MVRWPNFGDNTIEEPRGSIKGKYEGDYPTVTWDESRDFVGGMLEHGPLGYFLG